MALSGSTIASTFLKLLRCNADTMGADATASFIQDSADTDSALSISQHRVGIGTDTPGAILNSSAVAILQVGNGSASTYVSIKAGDSNEGMYAAENDARSWRWGINGSNDWILFDDTVGTDATRMTINSVGDMTLTGDIRTVNDKALEFLTAAAATVNGISVNSGDDMHIGDTGIDDMFFNVGSMVPAMQIKQTTGFVGIGNAPSYKLTVQTSNDAQYATGIIQDHPTGFGLYIETNGTTAGDSALHVKSNNGATDLLWVGNDGKVGIQNVAPGATLDSAVTAIFQVGNGSASTYMSIKAGENNEGMLCCENDARHWRFGIDGDNDFVIHDDTSGTDTTRLTVNSAGVVTVTAGACQSDERLKEDIENVENGLDIINQLQGRTFKWINDSNSPGMQYGLIAQELEKIVPELVYDTKMDMIDDKPTKSINMGGVIPLLIEAVKELSAKVTALENNNEQTGESNNGESNQGSDSSGDSSSESSGANSGGVEGSSSDSSSTTSGASETGESSSDDGG